MPERSYVGLIGLGVMGENLAINIASHGYSISVYNRTTERTRDFEKRIPQSLNIKATYSVGDFIKSLERPRRVILMVKAGKPVDEVLTLLRPYLDAGDVVFDCGNSFFRDTERRQEELQGLGVIFMGVGVSGGEEGALKGPSIMVGGEESGY
ncbi:MAG TPA: NADP-dependent phosphogluconate dehydrogenase, partial [Aigarchaeota archaeon]|nr:NADP-dependent phosphogluconate dehydrogenase [Aigarchaeota archaeon]